MASPTTLHEFQKSVENIDPSFFNEHDRKGAAAIARSLFHRLERPMDTMIRIAWNEPAYLACLKIGLDVGLYEELNNGEKGSKHSVEGLAAATKTHPEVLVRILRLLASMGAVSEVGDGLFSTTELSESLLKRPVNSAIDCRYLLLSPVFQHFPATLKRNSYQPPSQPAIHDAFDTKLSFFEWLGQNNATLEMFTNLMAGYASQRGGWEEIYPVKERLLPGNEGSESDNIILVDLGGGSGHDLKRFASKFLPALRQPRLVLQDLPEVIDQARKTGNLPDSIQSISVDFTKETPVQGARAYYMHSVLHDWPDKDVLSILKQIRPVLRHQSDLGPPRLLLNEIVLPKQGIQPYPASLDIIMMALIPSHERSEEQWTMLLESAGYKVNAIYSDPTVDEAVIEAEAVESL